MALLTRKRKNKDEPKKKNSRDKEIERILDYIDQGMKSLYKDTYYSTSDNSNDSKSINGEISNTLDNIINKVSNNINVSGISKLAMRTKIKNESIDPNEITNGITEIMEDESIIQQFSTNFKENLYIKEQDKQIDMLCQYFSDLDDAISTISDNVFSADHFSKDSISISGSITADKLELFENEKVAMKNKYKIEEKFEEWGKNASKYGEQFVYIVPYKQALERLLKLKEKNSGIVTESVTILNEDTNTDIIEGNDVLQGLEVVINCNMSGVLTDYVEAYKQSNTIIESVNALSISESFIQDINEVSEDKKLRFNKNIIPDDYKFDMPTTNDGFTNINKNQNTTNNESLKVTGCIVEELERWKVNPVYISNDTCVGYYNIDVKKEEETTSNISNEYNILSNSSLAGYAKKSQLMQTDNLDSFLTKLATKISKNIDAKFINSNLDLTHEIYLALKYSEIGSNTKKINVDVTFIPASDMIHVYYKMDPKTHRGISDLSRSLIPGTLYASMYLTDVLASITRGMDKRVYYIKQNIETNVSKTLLNTINQIKKGNFNIRSLNTMYNVLDIVGRYNDFIIPLSKGGESPIQFEVMQGQQIDIHTDLYELLSRLALNSTGVSKEMLEARNSLDYAIQATMSNTKFCRKMLKRQSRITPTLSRASTMIYNYEYNKNIVLTVSLPAPEILNITNIKQMLDASNDYANTIIDNEASIEDDREKAILRKKITLWTMGTHIPFEIIDKFIKESKIEFLTKYNKEE